METNIQIFTSENFGEIRTCQVNNQIMFVGKDVATALGYSNSQKAIRDHVDDDDKLTERFVLSGQIRSVVIINESGLYSLVLSSKLAQARVFKRWVTSEVLPQIRQTGGYIPTHDAQGRQLSNVEILMLADRIISKTLQRLNGPNTHCLTATEVAESWGMEVGSFNKLLRRMGVQYRKNGRWHLTKEYAGQGLTEDRVFLYYSLHGESKRKEYMVWTAKGVQLLNDLVSSPSLGNSKPRVIQLNFLVNNTENFDININD
jgi:prophage antirepressor-like protein